MLREAHEEEQEAVAEMAALVGARNLSVLAADVSSAGQAPAAAGARRRLGGGSPGCNQKDALLAQLKKEPKELAECAAKFALYEGYASEVEKMRGTLFAFYEESLASVPPAIATDMQKQLKAIDSREAMAVPDDARVWFVFHMMKQANQNNDHMARVLEGFEKKLELLTKSDQSECPVCLEDFAEGSPHAPETLSCCHKVCVQCWEHWTAVMDGRPFCPLCRNDDFLGAVARRATRV